MLMHRLKSAFINNKKLTFLIGSGLTAGQGGSLGVFNVGQIVSEIKIRLGSLGSGDLLQQRLTQDIPEKNYQIAMSTLLLCEGQEELNNVIIKAVLNARNDSKTEIIKDDFNLSVFENEVDNWYLTPGVEALGKLYVRKNQTFTGPILTTNFDPLIEISIKKAGGHPQTICLTHDGSFNNDISQNSQKVVHLHGYWHGSDTLHTVDQITKERPQLKGSIRKVLADKTLVVLGYGGWNDAFTKTLTEVIAEGSNNYNVIWAFYEREEHEIINKYKNLISSFGSSIHQRVLLYKGIDSNEILPNLVDILNFSKVNSELAKDPKDDSISIRNILTSTESDQKQENEISIQRTLKKFETNFNCDIPPVINHWVGREFEIQQIDLDTHKVIFLTGIGGQGKSALASHYVKNLVSKDPRFELWDWRDCKEEDNRIHTKLISIIERITNGGIRANNIINENIITLVDIFFDALKEKRIVFVFDNVDNYIDLETFLPSRGIGILFNQALIRNHKSKFIFTCRPHIRYSAPGFFTLSMSGLSLEETLELFRKYKPPINDPDLNHLNSSAHELTNGHALWLNLIAAQALRGQTNVLSFIEGIKGKSNFQENDFSSILAENTLKTVWSTLNSKQQILLRAMSETIRAEKEEVLTKILSKEINYNQFNKSFKILKSLNLIVIKSSDDEKDLYELHPLVKEFVRQRYPIKERSKYITLFLQYYDQIIYVLKPRLSSDSPLTLFENWTNKIELEINNGNFKSALASLHEVNTPLLTAGYIEEYIRVAFRLFIEINWDDAIFNEYTYFHDQIREFTDTLTCLGRYDEVNVFLKKYRRLIEGKGVHYISYCDMEAHLNWHMDKFEEAIHWAEQGIELKDKSNIETYYGLKHNLALAQRDSKQSKNIEKALKYFAEGESLGDILNGKISDRNSNGTFYGNIGRCFFLQKKYEEALICYVNSLNYLNEEKLSISLNNRGYACLWIAQSLEILGDIFNAFNFYELAILHWKVKSPPNAKVASNSVMKLVQKHESLKMYLNLKDWEVQRNCKDWLSNFTSNKIKRHRS